MNISGHTTPFAVLGHPIGHSLSPIMHNASIARLGMDAIYLAFDVAPQKLLDVSRLTGLGWRHLTSLGQGIEKTYKWYMRQTDKRSTINVTK